MPLYYSVVPGATQTTNGSANTANDAFFIKPGATRTVWLRSIYLCGRGAALTSISGITMRMEKWTSTASSAGTAVTPSPNDVGMQAAKHTAAFSATTLTSGTGGPTLLLSVGCGTTSPGNWVAPSNDEAYALEGAATQSIDGFNVSGGTSLVFEMSAGTME
jgi:hypothetical protein